MAQYSSPVRSAQGNRSSDRYNGATSGDFYSTEANNFRQSPDRSHTLNGSFRDDYGDRERHIDTRSHLQSLRDKYRSTAETSSAPLTRESLANFSPNKSGYYERTVPSHTTSTAAHASSTYSNPTDRLNVHSYRGPRLNDSYSSLGSTGGRLRDVTHDSYVNAETRSYGSAPDNIIDREYDGAGRYIGSVRRRESFSPSRGADGSSAYTKPPMRHDEPLYGSINRNMSGGYAAHGSRTSPYEAQYADRNGYAPRDRTELDSPTAKSKDQLRTKVHQVLRDKDREIYSLREKLSSLAMATHLSDPSPVPPPPDTSHALPHMSSLPSDKFLADLEHQCGKLRRELNEERQTVARLNSALDEVRIRGDDIASLREKKSQLEAHCQQQDELIARLTREKSDLESTHRQSQSTCNDHVRIIHELKNALDVANRESDELRRKNQRTGEELAQSQARVDELLRRNEELHSEAKDVRSLRIELDDFKSANVEWRAHAESIKAELDILRQKQLLQEGDAEERLQDTVALNAALMKCMTELNSLIGLCSMKAKGQDPNMTLILGIGGPSPSNPELMASLSGVVGPKKQLEVVHEMTHDIQKLRTMVNEAYVDDIDTSACAQQ